MALLEQQRAASTATTSPAVELSDLGSVSAHNPLHATTKASEMPMKDVYPATGGDAPAMAVNPLHNHAIPGAATETAIESATYAAGAADGAVASAQSEEYADYGEYAEEQGYDYEGYEYEGYEGYEGYEVSQPDQQKQHHHHHGHHTHRTAH